jgi:shikimate kinase
MLHSNLVTNTSPLSSDDSEHTIEYQRSQVVQSTITSTSEITLNWTKLGRQRPLLPSHAGYETRNIYLIGLPGSGKTTVGRELAKLLGKPHFDIDEDLLEKEWSLQQHTVASKYAALGDEGFIEAEGGETLRLNVESHIVSLTGSNPLHAKAMKYLSKHGIFVYLDTPIEFVVRRCEEMKMDRLVGQQTKSLPEILLYRLQFYEHYYDLRILINKDQSPLDIANVIVTRLKIQEEERHFQSYRSTRGYVPDDDQLVEFMDVVKEGMAPDGGIYIAHSFNPFTLAELERLLNLAYEEKTLRIMERFPLGTLHPSDLKQLLYSAYSAFSNREVLPVTHLWRNQYLIETYHGL